MNAYPEPGLGRGPACGPDGLDREAAARFERAEALRVERGDSVETLAPFHLLRALAYHRLGDRASAAHQLATARARLQWEPTLVEGATALLAEVKAVIEGE